MSPTARAVRRQQILEAARRCFARRGFSATTIADLCEESGLSAGGIYTHFENKHAIAEAIGDSATAPVEGDVDLEALGRRLLTDDGALDARLDLQLWAESLHDPLLHDMVSVAMDRFRSTAVAQGDDVKAGVVEALVLGSEVQRALGRPIDLEALGETIEWLTSENEGSR